MELAATYLLTVAAISITFAGFAALTVILRQLAGGRLTEFDVLFVGNVLIGGFMVAGCALLPPLLMSSFVTAVAQGSFLVARLRARRSVMSLPISIWSLVNYVGQWLATVFLLLVAMSAFFEPDAAKFTAGLTAFVLLGFIAYLIALETFVQIDNNQGKKRRRQ
jgi:hypothetical protein